MVARFRMRSLLGLEILIEVSDDDHGQVELHLQDVLQEHVLHRCFIGLVGLSDGNELFSRFSLILRQLGDLDRILLIELVILAVELILDDSNGGVGLDL